MKIVSSATEEVERLRLNAALYDEDGPAVGPFGQDAVHQLREHLNLSSSQIDDIESTKVENDLEAMARGQSHLDGAHIDLLRAWDEIAHAARQTKPPIPWDKIREPLITVVAHTGAFNAVSVRDVSGNTALVFDTSLIGALYIVGLHCGRAFFDWIESYVTGDMDRFGLGIVDLKGTLELHEILSSVVAHGGVAPDVILDCVRRADARSYLLGINLYSRIVLFLVGHEFSHFLYDHHLFDATKAEHRASPLYGLLQESLEHRAAHYADQLAEPSEKQIRTFLFDQFHEYQADEQSLTFLAASGGYNNKDPWKRRLFATDMAAVAMCFTISAAIERMVFIRIRGKDPVAHPLYSDYGVLNLCLRTTHPSPISRLAWIMGRINVAFFGGTEAADFFCAPVVRYINEAIGLDRGMRKYIRARPQPVASVWASEYSTGALLAKMWPGADRPNLGEWLVQHSPS